MKNQKPHQWMLIMIYFCYLLIIIITFDVLIMHGLFGYGYPSHYKQENLKRYPYPYVEFTGKPNVKDHNQYGFRGHSFNESKPNELKIAFFGGSTGYNGNPPIPTIVEKELGKLLDQSVFVANYSVASSNHRQHLHGIIEFLPQFKPDVIIFYGGFNETTGTARHDPRPGYPYNFFYREETSPFIKLLLEHSAIFGEIDKKTGMLSGLSRLQKEQQPYSDSWNRRIADKYFETLKLSHDISSTIESTRYGKTKFMAFYQPYQVPLRFISTHKKIKDQIAKTSYIFDVSSEYDTLGKDVYTDEVHVKQYANERMGRKIAIIVAEQLDRAKYK